MISMQLLHTRILVIFFLPFLIITSNFSFSKRYHSKCPVQELSNITTGERKAVDKVTKSLTLPEKILLLRMLHLTSVLLEYGDGDTVPIYCQVPLKTIIIISSNPAIQQVDVTACIQKQIHFLPYYITLGELGQYNSYIMNATIDLWSNYVKSFELFQSFQPNLYFINGKLRFAILFQLLIHLVDDNNIISNSRSREEIESRLSSMIVIMHDFYGIYYHSTNILYLYYDFMDCIDSMVILKPKSFEYLYLNKNHMMEDYNKYIKIYV